MNLHDSDRYPARQLDRGIGFLREADDFKDRLEKLGIFSGSGLKQSHSLASSRAAPSLNLHMNRPNTKPAPPPSSCDDDDSNDDDESNDDDDDDGDDDDEIEYGGDNDDDDFRSMLRRSSAESSRLGLAKSRENRCRTSAQILLSPLALNNSADHHQHRHHHHRRSLKLNLNHSDAFFTLEEDPYDEGDGEAEDDGEDGSYGEEEDEDDGQKYLQNDGEEGEGNELEARVASFRRAGLQYPPLGSRRSVSKQQRAMFLSPNHPRSSFMPVQRHWHQGMIGKDSGFSHGCKQHARHGYEASHSAFHHGGFHPDGQENASHQRRSLLVKPQARPRESKNLSNGRPNPELCCPFFGKEEKLQQGRDRAESNGIPDPGDARSERVEALQLAHVPSHVQCKELLAVCDYKPRNLSQKYRPKMFRELVGQSLVTLALSNAVIKEKIAPVYLFQGSRGTGKTTAARIFASALVCASSSSSSSSSSSLDLKRPCGACKECIDVAMGKCSEVKEVDAASNNGIEKVKALLEETISAPPRSRYKVFIVDECHVLTSETWSALLKILEEPPVNVVFILVTTVPDQLPRTALSRCQSFPFPKIKEGDIVKRLEELCVMEKLEVGSDTLQLIAARSDGSLRDAEMILDQLSLLGQQINPSTLYELVGSASDERMINLLDCALRADTVNTVRRVRELVDSGIEPLSLMARLATLVADILAGSFKFTEKQRHGFFSKVSEEKLEWLRTAMKTLSEAEKQVRVSNDRTTWLIAALLQLGPAPFDGGSCTTFRASCAGTSVTQSPVPLNYINMENAEFESILTSRQTWFDDDDDDDDDDGGGGGGDDARKEQDEEDGDSNTRFETAPTSNALQKGRIGFCTLLNQSELPLPLPDQIAWSPSKAEFQLIGQSTSYQPNKSCKDNLSRDTGISEGCNSAALDHGDAMKRSYDSKMQINRRGKVVRVGSLPSSRPNSPDGRAVSSRFTAHHHHHHHHDAGEAMEASSHNAVPHRRNKLKEAAGSLARFFKGSKGSQT